MKLVMGRGAVVCALLGASLLVERAPARPAAPWPAGAPPTETAIVDVDRSSEAALTCVPGVGPSIARRIVLDRARGGSFGEDEAVERVPGVGERVVEGLRDLGAGGAPSPGPFRQGIRDGECPARGFPPLPKGEGGE